MYGNSISLAESVNIYDIFGRRNLSCLHSEIKLLFMHIVVVARHHKLSTYLSPIYTSLKLFHASLSCAFLDLVAAGTLSDAVYLS